MKELGKDSAELRALLSGKLCSSRCACGRRIIYNEAHAMLLHQIPACATWRAMAEAIPNSDQEVEAAIENLMKGVN